MLSAEDIAAFMKKGNVICKYYVKIFIDKNVVGIKIPEVNKRWLSSRGIDDSLHRKLIYERIQLLNVNYEVTFNLATLFFKNRGR